MPLTARVRRELGRVVHTVATGSGDDRLLPTPTSLEIVASSGGFLLLRKGVSGKLVADTWHLSEEEAREQAAYEFELEEAGWTRSPGPGDSIFQT